MAWAEGRGQAVMRVLAAWVALMLAVSMMGCVNVYKCNDQIRESYQLGRQHGRAFCDKAEMK